MFILWCFSLSSHVNVTFQRIWEEPSGGDADPGTFQAELQHSELVIV